MCSQTVKDDKHKIKEIDIYRKKEGPNFFFLRWNFLEIAEIKMNRSQIVSKKWNMPKISEFFVRENAAV